jgi:hypothetical protein
MSSAGVDCEKTEKGNPVPDFKDLKISSHKKTSKSTKPNSKYKWKDSRLKDYDVVKCIREHNMSECQQVAYQQLSLVIETQANEGHIWTSGDVEEYFNVAIDDTPKGCVEILEVFRHVVKNASGMLHTLLELGFLELVEN